MISHNIEQELFALEKEYWQAIVDQDVDAVWGLTDDPCFVTGAEGVGKINRKDIVSMLRNAPYVLNGFELSEPEVRMLTDEVAILAYKVKEEMTVEGKFITVEAADSSTWVKRPDGWVCALHTESIKGDPYGRDRNLNFY